MTGFEIKMKRILAIILCLVCMTSITLALPPSRFGSYAPTPQMQFIKLDELAEFIKSDHIYSGINANPLLDVYRAYYDTDETPTRAHMRQEFIETFENDADAYYVVANQMLSSLDKYSCLLTESQYDSYYPDSESYKGLGIVINQYGPFIRVNQVYDDSGAGRAGVEKGDLIAYINKTDIRAVDYGSATELLAQSADTQVTLGILRDGELMWFDVTADDVVIPNVEWNVLDDGTAYLRITLFEDDDDFKGKIDQAVAGFSDAGCTKLLLDVRDNRGGSVDLLNYALNSLTGEKDELLFSQVDRYSSSENLSDGSGMSFDDIVVLVNGYTCSSAEILSGSLRDRGATLVGTQTYGKSIGLGIYDYYGDLLVLAIMKAQLPTSPDYNEIGLVPDVEVENEPVYCENEDLKELDTDVDIKKDSVTKSILALEQRLDALGYSCGEVDGVWDDDTMAGVNELCEGLDISRQSYCPSSALAKLEDMMGELESAYYYNDTQMDTALGLLENSGQNAA